MARIDIRGVIIPNSYKWFYDWLKEDSTCPRDVFSVLSNLPDEPHDVYINSPGGVIDSGSEIYTMLRGHKPGINIYITGQAHSAASVIAMSGHSYMSPTALMMVHCVSTGMRGNHSDMEHMAEVLRTADRALCRAYMSKSGMTEAQALAMMEHETWMTAEMAVSKGLIDEIMFEPTIQEPITAGLFELPTEEQMARAKLAISQAIETEKIKLWLMEGEIINE